MFIQVFFGLSAFFFVLEWRVFRRGEISFFLFYLYDVFFYLQIFIQTKTIRTYFEQTQGRIHPYIINIAGTDNMFVIVFFFLNDIFQTRVYAPLFRVRTLTNPCDLGESLPWFVSFSPVGGDGVRDYPASTLTPPPPGLTASSIDFISVFLYGLFSISSCVKSQVAYEVTNDFALQYRRVLRRLSQNVSQKLYTYNFPRDLPTPYETALPLFSFIFKILSKPITVFDQFSSLILI